MQQQLATQRVYTMILFLHCITIYIMWLWWEIHGPNSMNDAAQTEKLEDLKDTKSSHFINRKDPFFLQLRTMMIGQKEEFQKTKQKKDTLFLQIEKRWPWWRKSILETKYSNATLSAVGWCWVALALLCSFHHLTYNQPLLTINYHFALG